MLGFPGGAGGKESACQCRRWRTCGFHPSVGKIPWSRKWQPVPVFLPGKFYGQRSLAAYSPWDHRESDMTKWLSTTHTGAMLLNQVKSVHWKDWCWSWSSNTLATWCEELIHRKRPLCSERLKAGREGDDRGWDGWMASPTQWTWVWASSGGWWRRGEAGVLQSMELLRVRHDLATEQSTTTTTTKI